MIVVGFERITPDATATAKISQGLLDFHDQLGENIKANAKRIVPVDSGDAKKSIVHQVGEIEPGVVELHVGYDTDILGVDYDLYFERGTSKMAAQPTLTPATLQAGGTIASTYALVKVVA